MPSSGRLENRLQVELLFAESGSEPQSLPADLEQHYSGQQSAPEAVLLPLTACACPTSRCVSLKPMPRRGFNYFVLSRQQHREQNRSYECPSLPHGFTVISPTGRCARGVMTR